MIRLPLPTLCAAALGGLAAAQRPSCAPLRLGAGDAIRIDARLDEPAWQRAEPIGELVQVVPIEGAEPAVATEVRIAFDAETVYVALRCFDDPARVRGRLMERDAVLDPDDRVELWFDTFHDRRFAYWFQIGAGGSKGDALLSDAGRRFNKSWDGIWYGRARRTPDGWQAELGLPMKTLAFDPDGAVWGFNLRRLRKEDESESRWAAATNAYRFFDLAAGGELTGLGGLHQGIGLDVTPYAKVAAAGDRSQDSGTSVRGDFGADLSYRITPSLNLRLTYDTDFAETEVDARQVNLTRFPLFFPEQRDFFLEDAGLFEFGNPSRAQDTIPFFSRRIGRNDDGTPRPIVAGARLTGRVGDWNVGLLQTVVDRQEEQAAEGLGVLRVSRNVGAESSVGMIFASGDPSGDGYASTQGVDFALRDSELFGRGQFAALWGYYLDSTADEGGGDGASYGLEGELRTRDWLHSAYLQAVDDEFDPRLGFVQRRGIRRYRWNTSYTWRPNDGSLVRRIDWRVSPIVTNDARDGLDSWALPWRWFQVTLDTEDYLRFETHRIFERIDEPFTLRSGAAIAAGDYLMTRHFATLSLSDQRPLSGQISLEAGDFYDGSIVRLGFDGQLVASRFWQLAFGIDDVHVDVDSGRFDTQVYEGRLDLTFDPTVSLRNLVQYDTDSESLSVQSRLRVILEPGSELFVVGLAGWQPGVDGGGLAPGTQDVTLKVFYTVRF
ncbi:MAG: carbohydrate binding family 9 domain-containing protein [Planctomycetes bacterium]|nr:carbohydrate binding family 9 domain-containing protein [Planctomycetota bacterium]